MGRIPDLIRQYGEGPEQSPDPEPPTAISYRQVRAEVLPEDRPDAVAADPDWCALAHEELRNLEERVRACRPIHLEAAQQIAEGIAGSFSEGDGFLAGLLSVRSPSPVINNMVNVSILATRVAKILGWAAPELKKIALAGLLHDVGMFRLSENLVTSEGRLSPDARRRLRQHPALGAQIVMEADGDHGWLASVILHEHERWNGSGYPNGLKQSLIHEYARIIGLVDIFDALCSPRSYRRSLLPHEAVQVLLISESSSFPRPLIKAVVSNFSLLPMGNSRQGEVENRLSSIGGSPSPE